MRVPVKKRPKIIVSDFQETENFVFGTSIVAGNKEVHAELLQMITAENF